MLFELIIFGKPLFYKEVIYLSYLFFGFTLLIYGKAVILIWFFALFL